MNNKKLTAAPNLKHQSKEPFATVYALVGSEAWNAWGYKDQKGKTEEWLLIKPAIDCEQPLILGGSQLGNLQGLQLAKDNHHAFKLYQFGEITEAEKSALLLNLATQTNINAVQFFDNAAQFKDDYSDYVKRLREDEDSRRLVKIHAAEAQTYQQPKREPYIEYRENGIKKGLFFITPRLDKETGEVIDEKEKWICDNLEIIGKGKDEGGSFHYVFKWQNGDDKEVNIISIPMADFGTESSWKTLKAKAFRMTSAAGLTAKLTDYFHFFAESLPMWTITSSSGWQNGAYIFPNGEIIGTPSTPIIFTNKSGSKQGYESQGTLAEWQENIAKVINKNHSMMTAFAVSFACPLLELLKADSFGINLYNSSTAGKSTILNAACSIWGNPELIRFSWNTTAHAINNEATARNDGFIALDELGEAKKVTDVDNIAYTLFNGTGRLQGLKEGGNSELNRWKIAALSTAEMDLEGYLFKYGIEVKAGQLMRLLNIPFTSAEHFHQFKSPKEHGDHINATCKQFYGTAGREWIKYLIEHKADVSERYAYYKKIWLERLPQDAAGQVQRVADRFAILETALQLSIFITQWQTEDISVALYSSFQDWLAEYGTRSREETKLIEFLNSWILSNCEGAFYDYPDNGRNKGRTNLYGYRVWGIEGEPDKITKEHFYFFKAKLEELLSTKDFNKKTAFNTLANEKMLVRGKEKDRPFLTKVPKIIDKKQPRCYLIYPIDESEEENEE